MSIALVALVLAPTALGALAPAPPALAVVRDPRAILDALPAHIARALDRAPFLLAPAAVAPTLAAPEPLSFAARGSFFVLEGVAIATGGFEVPAGATLLVRNATIVASAREGEHPAIRVPEGSTLVLRDARVVGAGGPRAFAWLDVEGSLDAARVTFDAVAGDLRPAAGSIVTIRDAVFTGAERGVSLMGAATVSGSLFYNTTGGAALVLGAGASATESTFVHNHFGVRIAGEGASVTRSTFRLNVAGVWWSGVEGATVSENNFLGSYMDALYGVATNGATLDASDNWWDGTPNVNGESWAGFGVSVSRSASSAFALADRSAEVPFPLRVFRSDATWPAGAPLDGPILARAGTLTIAGGVLDANAFRMGSHARGALRMQNVEVVDHAYVFSRGADVFDGLVMREGGSVGFDMPGVASASGGLGLVVVQGSATVRNSHFSNMSAGVAQVARSLIPADTVVPLTVRDTTFEDVEIALITTVAQPTIAGVTVRRSLIAVLSALCASASVVDTLVTDSDVGIADIASQGFAASGNSVYNTLVGFLLAATTSPTVTRFEGRFNGLNFAAAGAQLTLTSSNLYDDPFFGVYAAPLIVEDVELDGRVTIDPTTYVGDAVHGDVSFVPPRKASPSATPGRTSSYAAQIVGSGQTLALAGPVALGGPLIVRAGGTLDVQNATVDVSPYLIGVQPGGRLVIRDSTIRGGPALFVHSSDARITGSTFTGARFGGLFLVESHAQEVRGNRFLDSPYGVDLWDSRALLERNLFGGEIGLAITNDTLPRTGDPVVRESFFIATKKGVEGQGNPLGRIVDSSFRVPVAIDNGRKVLLDALYVDQGTARLDARGNWFGQASGPKPGQVRWAGPEPTVLTSPWRTDAFRASFATPTDVVTDAAIVPFNDTSFDLDDASRSWTWTFEDGSPPQTTRNATHTFLAHGPRVVTLAVDDAYGWTSRASRTILVKAVPRAILDGPAEATTLETLAFNASASFDPDGRVVAWRFRASDGLDTGFASSATLAHAFARSGLHWVEVEARDDEGHVGAPARVAVEVADRPPIARIVTGPLPADRVRPLAFRDASVDLDGSIVSRLWDFGGGGTSTLEAPTYLFAALGDHSVTLRVVDDRGGAAETTLVVPVVNLAPRVSFAPHAPIVEPGHEARFTPDVEDEDGAIASLVWDFGDGSTLPVADASPVAHVYPDEGVYNVTLTATDDEGAVAVHARSIRVVHDIPPTPAFRASPSSGDTSTFFRFIDESVDPDGQVVAWAWDFGDGATSSESSPTHRFLDAGLHTVRLRVTDDLGVSAETTREILVDDVLDARVAPEPWTLRSDRAVELRVETRWANGTGVPAAFVAEVFWMPLAGASVDGAPYARFVARTDLGGRALVEMPSIGGQTPPGEYVVRLRASTMAGHARDLESAEASARFEVTREAPPRPG